MLAEYQDDKLVMAPDDELLKQKMVELAVLTDEIFALWAGLANEPKARQGRAQLVLLAVSEESDDFAEEA